MKALKRWFLSRLFAWQRRTRLVNQLTLVVTALAIVVTMLISTVLFTIQYRYLHDAQRHDLETQARILASNSTAAMAFGDADAAREMLEALRASPDVIGAQLRLGDGTVLAHYLSPQHTEAEHAAPPLSVRAEVREGEAVFGELVIASSYGTANRRLALSGVMIAVLLIGAPLLLRGLFVGLLGPMTRPIDYIVETMKRVAREGDYSLRTNIRAANETGEVSAAFDAMLDQIQRRDEKLAQELIERRKAEARLDHLARHDSLTNLPNRVAFNEAMRARPAATLAVLMLDMDRFKAVNDTHGHNTGDAVLQGAARSLAESMPTHARLFRMGGDEFAVVLDHAKPGTAMALAERLLAVLARPQRIGGQTVAITGSAGIALYPQHAGEPAALLRLADTALYDAKNRGRNLASVYDPVMGEASDQRRALEQDLRQAVGNHELFLVYQPQLDLKTGRITGAEALVRWKHPQRGMVSPGEFVPLAEETGLIQALGDWVLHQACADGAQLMRAGWKAPFRLSVNLSPLQLKDPGLAERVGALLAETGFPGDRLELEITESAAIEDPDGAAERMRALTRHDVSFAMDDFGVGATSLSYLKKLPLSLVKIDRSFVRDLPDDTDDAAITTAIIRMAHELHKPVLAEGVETPEQLAFLRERGCDFAQGYFISRGVAPLEAALKTKT